MITINVFQVLLLFFMFVMAFSSTFYLLLDEETVRFKVWPHFLLCISLNFHRVFESVSP